MPTFCTLKGDYIFAVPFKTPTELQELSMRYGTPMFVPNLKPLRLTPLKLRALRMYVSNPQISSSDLVEELGWARRRRGGSSSGLKASP